MSHVHISLFDHESCTHEDVSLNTVNVSLRISILNASILKRISVGILLLGCDGSWMSVMVSLQVCYKKTPKCLSWFCRTCYESMKHVQTAIITL